MTLRREVVESFIRLIKAEIVANAVLVPRDDVFEVTKVPSFILLRYDSILTQIRRPFSIRQFSLSSGK